MERVKYRDLRIGDILLIEDREFVFLGKDSDAMVGLHNVDQLHYFPMDLVLDEDKCSYLVVRRVDLDADV